MEKFKGAFAGFVIGDAIGMPYEGTGITEFSEHKIRPIETTDDTEQMLILTESILSTTYFSPEDFAFRLCRMKSPRIGPTTAEALRRLRSGVPWREAGIDSNTCGAAMRVMPIGLAYSFNLSLVESYAVAQAVVTHRGKAAIAGSVAVAIAFACLYNGYTAEEMLKEVCRRCREYDGLMAEKIKISRERSLKELGTSILSTDVVPAAFHCFLNSSSYEECVMMAIKGGGDVDTIAAIAGGLKGVELGYSEIPDKWRGFAYSILPVAEDLYSLYLKISK